MGTLYDEERQEYPDLVFKDGCSLPVRLGLPDDGMRTYSL
jgi:hypothetical protein